MFWGFNFQLTYLFNNKIYILKNYFLFLNYSILFHILMLLQTDTLDGFQYTQYNSAVFIHGWFCIVKKINFK